MSDVEVHGPIDFLLIEFVGDKMQGASAAALMDLIDRGIVRLYDLAVIRKEADGTVEALELTSDVLSGFGAFAGARSGLLSAQDVAEAAEVLSAGTTAVLIVFENAWAIPFVAAAIEEGGTPIASARIPALDVIAALDELDASL